MIALPSHDVFKDQFLVNLMDFARAAELRSLADELIERHPDLFDHLPQMRIDYLWKREGGSSKGKATFEKMSGLKGWYSSADFVIWLAYDHIKIAQFDAKQIEAVLFHEMLHVGEPDEETGTVSCRPHDFEGFRDELAVYGFWNYDLKLMRQLPLFSAAAAWSDEVERLRDKGIDVSVHAGGEPHLHRHTDEKYPAGVCTEVGCTLEPRYPVDETFDPKVGTSARRDSANVAAELA